MAALRVVGTSAAVFFALCGSASAGADVNADPVVEDQVDAKCTVDSVGKACTGDGAINAARGVCIYEDPGDGETVNPLSPMKCSDVCNPSNPKTHYKVASLNAATNINNIAFQSIVNEVRCGFNLNVKCPDQLNHVDEPICDEGCELGKKCNQGVMDRRAKRTQFNIAQSMCVMDKKGKHTCADMCDLNNDLDYYAEGTESGIREEVVEARAHPTLCPASRTMTTVWIVCIVVLLCAACAASYLKCRRNKKGGSAPSSSRAYENDYMEDYAGQGEGYADMPEPASPREDDWQLRQQEDFRAQQEYEMQQQQIQMPPEPPRMDSGRSGAMQRDLLDLNLSYRGAPQPPSPTAGMPAASSMQIPGLSEPNLFAAASIKPLTMPGSSVLMPSVSHVGYNSRATSMNQSHYTQVPPVFMTSTPAASPPTSLQAPAGVLGQTQSVPGVLGTTQQNFFTTIARR